MRRLTRISLAFTVALICAVAVQAQKADKTKDDGTRSVKGQVVDPDNKAAVRAVVQLTDLKTLQVRSFITQDDGEYRFSGLRADTDYEVRADFQGMSSPTRRLTVFDNRKIATIDLKLAKK
jgi:Carboxypeptidase regulatory-like domain